MRAGIWLAEGPEEDCEGLPGCATLLLPSHVHGFMLVSVSVSQMLVSVSQCQCQSDLCKSHPPTPSTLVTGPVWVGGHCNCPPLLFPSSLFAQRLHSALTIM